MVPVSSSKEVSKKVAHHALGMALGTFSSRILGLLRDMAMAALFTRTVTDAWTAAFRLPNLFRRLLGEGSLSVSFIPVFVEARMDSSLRAQNLANGFYTLLLVFLAVLTALGILFAEPIMGSLLEPSYGLEKFAFTVRMARIMFGFVFFISTYAYFMGILNALGKFTLPAMAPTLFNVAMIFSTLIPGSFFSFVGDGLAWGVFVGGALQMWILVPALSRLGAMPRFRWQGFNEDIRRVLRNMLPGLLGMGLLQFTTLVNLRYASGLAEGAISSLYWADRLLELPLSLVSVSLGSALLPTLAALWGQGKHEQMASTTNYYLRLNLFVAIPAALGLYFLARPIVEVLFLRGKFTAADAELTAAVLKVYAGLLISASCARVFVPAYYAIKNAWLPALASLLSLGVHIGLAPLFMKSWGLEGLVLSSFLSATLNSVLLLGFYPKFIGAFDYVMLAKHSVRFILAGGGLVVSLQVYGILLAWLEGGSFVKALILALTIFLGALVYAGISFALKTEELKALSGFNKISI
ncbi:MAG: murein biosynthesis integral membrane protein MurJ [Pseudobdellovibrionaceae bacterium]